MKTHLHISTDYVRNENVCGQVSREVLDQPSELYIFDIDALAAPFHKLSPNLWTSDSEEQLYRADILSADISPRAHLFESQTAGFQRDQLDATRRDLVALLQACKVPGSVRLVIVPWSKERAQDHRPFVHYLNTIGACYDELVFESYSEQQHTLAATGRTAAQQFKFTTIASIVAKFPSIGAVTVYDTMEDRAGLSLAMSLRTLFNQDMDRDVFVDWHKIDCAPVYVDPEQEARIVYKWLEKYRQGNGNATPLFPQCVASQWVYEISMASQMMLLQTFKSLLKPNLQVIGDHICMRPGCAPQAGHVPSGTETFDITEVGASKEGIVYIFKLVHEASADADYMVYLQRKNGRPWGVDTVAAWHRLPQPVPITTTVRARRLLTIGGS